MSAPHAPRRDKLVDDPAEAAAARQRIIDDPGNVYLRLKVTVYRYLFPGPNESSWIDSSIILLIAANIIAVVLETESSLANAYMSYFVGFEWFSSVVFSIEYVLRLWVADLLLDPRRPWRSRWRYVRSFMALVDLLALIPFYLPMFIAVDARMLRAIRLVRLVRVLKMGRYAQAVFTLVTVLQRKREQLAMASFILVLLLLISATAIYYAEHQVVFTQLADGTTISTADPDDPFNSIPSSMWWAVITLTTVGYGDVVPSSPVGKMIAAAVALLGVGFVAIPTGILAAGFAEQLEDDAEPDAPAPEPDAPATAPKAGAYCPHCGEKLHGD